MNLMQPDALVLEYTQTMMGFLMIKPKPQHIGMIGLGGGSIAKFCHRYLPKTNMTVVEINPHVIALRDQFQIPPNGDRFTVIEGDGADFVRQAKQQYDILIMDGFGLDGIPAPLSSQQFYDDCRDALPPGGVFIANLHTEDADYDTYLSRIHQSFGPSVLVVEEPESAQSTVFACKGPLPSAPKKGQALRPAKLPDSAWHQLDAAFANFAQAWRKGLYKNETTQASTGLA
jgi:spermidine synthase